jgi:dephospho-CoA kinase
MLRVAVTGGIACGKSLVIAYLRSQGFAVCDADDIAHRTMAPGGTVYDAVVESFGSNIVDDTGQINRDRLSAIVFSDPRQLTRLNELVHPVVRQEIGDWLSKQTSGVAAAFVEVPLLFEAGMAEGWDAIICVGCSDEVEKQRMRDRGLCEEDIEKRLSAQLPLQEKQNRSDFVIWNDGSRDELEQQISGVLKTIQER